MLLRGVALKNVQDLIVSLSLDRITVQQVFSCTQCHDLLDLIRYTKKANRFGTLYCPKVCIL